MVFFLKQNLHASDGDTNGMKTNPLSDKCSYYCHNNKLLNMVR